MKLLHLSDLHLGKRIHAYSMLDAQADILQKILTVADDEQPDGILLAGDIYDKAIPPVEAVQLFDWFLNRLADRKLPVYIISGNHDSAERLSFGADLMQRSGIYFSPVYSGTVEPIACTDAFGTVDIFLLPFLKPAHVRRFHEDETIESYTDAMRCAIAHMPVDPTHRSVLVTHQFVTGAARSDSEEISVGGTDNVDASVFAPFDYVALGHIHSPQSCGEAHIRYCGTPLKYSFSEVKDRKSVTVVELLEKGQVDIRTVPLCPVYDWAEKKGTFEELTDKSIYTQDDLQKKYVHLILTDEEDVPNAITKLRTIYPRLMQLDYDNTRTRTNQTIEADEESSRKSPQALFSQFYELQNNQPLSDEQNAYLEQLIEGLQEGRR